jgi:uncharacterized protein YidB (DUF937 family)
MIALGALLVGKLLSGRSNSDEAVPQGANAPASDGGLFGGLGGLLGKLTEAGQGAAVDSWVKPGPNQPISPGSLGGALGSQTISDLARQAGVSEQELLEQLAKVLPGVVDNAAGAGS